MTDGLAPAFTPTTVDAGVLATRTVGRDAIIERIGRRIRDAAKGGGRAHLLVVGPRGAGKTHVLRVATYLALEDADVADRVALVTLPEDAPDVVTYPDLLFAVLRQRWPALVKDLGAARTDPSELERRLLEALGNRALVLVLENLDRLFADLGEQGRGRLRSFVETSGAVLLLASTPALFSAVSDHDAAWYGAFSAERLEDLGIDEGREVLGRVAEIVGNRDLRDFLTTDAARGRLEAVTRLTGGSPRMWMILGGCLTRTRLEELVPLVTEMLDELVPYYQSRLAELPGVERKLVVELCRGSRVVPGGGVRTAEELASACGVSARVASTTLGRLERDRWVRRHKVPGTDQRVSYYEIAEPMLRHHIEYRAAAGGTLPVIVSFLRDWYTASERREQLAVLPPGSMQERYLTSALGGGVRSTLSLYAAFSTFDLLVAARRVLSGDAGPAQRLEASVAEAVALLFGPGGRAEAEDAVAERPMDELTRDALMSGLSAAETAAETGDVLAALDTMQGAFADRPDEERVAVGLLAASWAASADILTRLAALESICDDSQRLGLDHLRIDALHSLGRDADARQVAESLLESSRKQLGERHESVLQARLLVEALRDPRRGTAERGAEDARWRELLGAMDEHLGAEDLLTLAARQALAGRHIRQARPTAALAVELTALHADARAALGSDHPITQKASFDATMARGIGGEALDAAEEIEAMRGRVVTPSDIRLRTGRAQLLVAAGKMGEALAVTDEILADDTVDLGPSLRHHVLAVRARATAGMQSITAAISATVAFLEIDAQLDRSAEDRLGSSALVHLADQFRLDEWFPARPTRALEDGRRTLLGFPGRPFLVARWCLRTVDDDTGPDLLARIADCLADDLPTLLGGLVSAVLQATPRPTDVWIAHWTAALHSDESGRIALAMLESTLAALDGDAAARMRLPPELRTVVDEVVGRQP